MAIELKAVLSIEDRISKQMKRATRSVTDFGSRINEQSKQLTGLQTRIVGIAGAFAGAAAGAKLFNSTIKEAAKFEMSEITVEAMINDKAISDDYMKMIDRLALKSPLMDSGAMLGSSKGLVSLTKDLKTLESTWGLVEKMLVLSPEAGIDGSIFALKELASHDVVSMSDRFNLPKKALHAIKNLPFDQQVKKMHELLATMNITDEVVQKISNTSMSKWSQLSEKTAKFFRDIGDTANGKIGQALGKILDMMDDTKMGKLAKTIDTTVGKGIDKFVEFAKKVWEMREPILAVAKVIGTFVGIVATIVGVTAIISGIGAAIAFLGSPIGALALGIIGISRAFKLAYEKVEPFRKAVDTVVGTVSSLFMDLAGRKADSMDLMTRFGLESGQIKAIFAFSGQVKDAIGRIKESFGALTGGGGVSGAMEALGFSLEMISKVTDFMGVIKTKAGELVAYLASKWEALKPGIATLIASFMSYKDTAVTIFTSLWGFLQPIFGALVSAFKIVADVVVIAFNNVIAPIIRHVMTVFSLMWKILGPILKLVGAAIGVAFEVLRIAWDTVIKPFVNFMTTVFKKALELSLPIIEKIGGAFDVVGGIISQIAGWLNDFTGALKSFKVPNWLSKLGGGGTVKFEESGGSGQTKSHYNGIDYVPTNGYQANLHKGEAVLTAQENKERKQGGGGITIAKLADTIIMREDSDIEEVALKIARLIEREGNQMS